MRPSLSLRALSALVLLTASTGGALHAQQSRSHAHIGHVATAFQGTPEGMGLLPTAEAEARVALQHAGLAARSPDDLAAMKRHAAHVLHAVDPTRVESGPGQGYGLIQAAEGVIQHIEAAAGEGASDPVKTHATHIAGAAGNVAARGRRMAELAEGIQAAGTAAEAAPMAAELETLAQRAVSGYDADGDGRIGWQEGEGGLETARTHLTLLLRAEGMS